MRNQWKRRLLWWGGGLFALLVLGVVGGVVMLSLSGSSAASIPPAVYESKAGSEGMAIAPERAVPAVVGEAAMPMPPTGADEALDFVDAATAGTTTTRMVIKNADMAVVVDDPRAAQSQVIAWVEAHGGYVVASSLSERTLASGKRVLYGETTFRVPADRFLDALAMLKDLAVRVDREDIRGQDVTDEYVDLEARLRNLQAAEEELRRLLDQAADTNEVLNIYRELMQVREQIEVLQGRMRYLQESVAYSEVQVEFIPVEADEPISIGGWEPSGVARDAVRALLRFGQQLVTAFIWIGVFWLPVLAVLGIIGSLAWRLGRGLWRRMRGRAAPPTAR